MRTWQIYALLDPTSHAVRYVGVTFRGKQRLTEHLSKARKGGRTHRDCWLRGLLTKGLMPVHRVLETGSGESWQGAERRWIAHYARTSNLVNHTLGGEGTPGYVPTRELRAKWSRARRGRKYATDRVPGMMGKRHTLEARAKIASASTGREHSASAKARVSAARMGKPLSDAHRERISAAKRGRSLALEHKAKIASSTSNRRAVVRLETNEVFASITAAAKAIGVTEASVNQAIRKGCRCKGSRWRFAEISDVSLAT